jgi:hypothetical protein
MCVEYKSTRGETILILKKGEQMIKPNELFASSGLKLDQFNVMLYKLFILKNLYIFNTNTKKSIYMIYKYIACCFIYTTNMST